LYPVGDTETPITLCYVLLPTEDLDNTTMGRNWCQSALKIDPPSASNFDPPPVKEVFCLNLS
ncbi:MAG: hypothetical protein QUS33_10200, partial [Dehalococcoidia bacterium]|nr:hypothetical protein [Dehalococcoidia bacterium]